MIHLSARMSVLILAFGIFFTISCNTLEKSESNDSTNRENITLQQQLENLNLEISENPGNTNLQTEKANLLYQYSQSLKDPEARNPIYQNIRDIAESYSVPQVDDLLKKGWQSEKNRGIRLLQNDESEESLDYEVIESHFRNAITLIPDSLQTYDLLATTYYRHGNINEAIQTLEQAKEYQPLFDPSTAEKLAYLYLESGDLAEAERRYKELVEFNPDNSLFKHGLVNVLILSNEHEEAIEVLEQLIEDFPTRYSYQESLATELYYLFQNKTDRYLASGDNNHLSNEEMNELIEILNSVHTIFENIQESLPTSEDLILRMASFYKNSSLRLNKFPVMNAELQELQEDFMEYSLPLWEQLTEINSNNMSYVSNLYDVYLELGMDQEAESIQRSYNF